jgi:hypothetical protein
MKMPTNTFKISRRYVALSQSRMFQVCSPTSFIPILIIRASEAMVLLQQRQIYNLDIVFYCLSGKVLSYRQNQCLRGKISSFQQQHEESVPEAWERFVNSVFWYTKHVHYTLVWI